MGKHSSSSVAGAFNSQPWSIYKQTNSKNWFVRFSIKGQGQIRKSLQTADEKEADRKAARIYYEALLRAEQGLEARDKTVRVLADEWIAEGVLKAPERTALSRYIVGYFGDDKPSDITYRGLQAYRKWRLSYWTEGPGKNLEMVVYQRLGRQIRRPVTRKTPTRSTLNSEQVVFKKFLTRCQNLGHIKTIPKFDKIEGEVHNRPGFSHAEIEKILSVLRKRTVLPALSNEERYPHILLYGYVGIMCGSGMRPIECQKLRWIDLVGFDESRNAKLCEGRITVRVHGKGKSREFVPLDGTISDFLMIWDVQKIIRGSDPDPNDYIFVDIKGRHIQTFNPEVVSLLEECSLRQDYRGIKRTSYSFRHYYITFMINAHANIYDIAKNCGTSVAMIEKFYSHVTLESIRDRLRPSGTRI
ncbi:integrase family protein [Gluconacetobacter diazotrophicus PA1 5]|uniref:tyrosine-type recombinase/integrase n=1 Tax=Gluconacetobacter diazotrophicus TaxID=33996 RepID=UPI000181EFA8|nr:tyrosine-type recombinase/integrase [Gluconacetobacter diazotrophicus]ACI50337.1 integrase family protein [Gluconacetobacter diazotrophicus PA1 5]